MTYDVIVVGGGLAGCSAAIQLANLGHSVLLLEKKRFPVGKLCGEFLSTEVQGQLRRLGIYEEVLRAGAHEIRRANVTTSSESAFSAELPGVGFGLSRGRLDALLFAQAQQSGAICCEGAPVREISGNLGRGFRVTLDDVSYGARVVLGAHGKRTRLDRRLGRSLKPSRTPWIAFKAHYKGDSVPHTIELHAFPGGYCGTVQIEDGLTNVCWIANKDKVFLNDGPEGMIESELKHNVLLADRLNRLTLASGSFEAIAHISFEDRSKFASDVCMIGDSAGMIAPLCGDGMAMALRSAELAVPLAAGFLRGRVSANAFKSGYERAWNREFKQRMRLGRLAHSGFTTPAVANLSVGLFGVLPSLGTALIRNTRG